MNTVQKNKTRRYSHSEFEVIIGSADGSSKLVVAVSKKVAKRAVDRNRIRRIIKEAVKRTTISEGKTTFIVKRNINQLKSTQVEEILKELIK